MEKISAKVVTDSLRNTWIENLKNAFSDDYEICQTASGTIYIPVVDLLGDDRWVKISVIIPKTSEEDGTDGYSLSEEYRIAQEEKAEKAKEKAEAKAKKIAKDKKKREEKSEKEEAT